MSRHFNEETLSVIKMLVESVTLFEEGSDVFNFCEKYAVTSLENADSMVFFNKKEMDALVTSLSEKLIFHGFLIQADDLTNLYKRYIPDNLTKTELNNRMNAVKFLTALCERPTEHLAKDPFGYKRKEEAEEIVDWPAYLNEGIERWSPPLDDEDSDIWSDDELMKLSLTDRDSGDSFDLNKPKLKPLKIELKDELEDYSNPKEYLKSNVQNTWFTKDHICLLPESTNIEANIGIKWEEFFENKTYGMIPRSNVITEYLAVREILWQFFSPTSANVFKLVGDKIIPRDDVTISSVRQPTFEIFLQSFVPYFALLQEFRTFYDNVWAKDDEDILTVSSNTYQNYATSYQKNIIEPVLQQLVAIERETVKQETTLTILSLAKDVKQIFKQVAVLKEIHQNVTLDFYINSPLKCATTLLAKLHVGLEHCTTKLEQDIGLTLYVESLYKYLSIVDCWLRNGKWSDLTGEFIIADSKLESLADPQTQFLLRNIDDFVRANSIIKIICTTVLEIGKNIRLLFSMRKNHVITSSPETLYDEVKRRFLEEITIYFQENKAGDNQTILNENIGGAHNNLINGYDYKYPATCLDYCKYPTEFDRLENMVDTSDGFLISSFEGYFSSRHKATSSEITKATLFEQISSITKSLFPAHEILKTVLSTILQEKHSHYGLIVKGHLETDYKLKEHLELLKNVFLFKDDIIFPFYSRLFTLLNSGSNWGNDIWLTSHLQDIIIDYHPDLFDKCSVTVKEYWKECKDPIKACDFINIHYRIDWPVNIIINDAQLELYQDIFQFILKIKWALFTLNNLYFSELEPKKNNKKHQKHKSQFRNIPQRLRVLKFWMINQFMGIQHFVLGYVSYTFAYDFERKFEKAISLDSLISAHADYINFVHKCCTEVRDFNIIRYGFNMLLYSVWELKKMWMNVKEVNDKELQNCEEACKKSFHNLKPIICPREFYVDYSSSDDL